MPRPAWYCMLLLVFQLGTIGNAQADSPPSLPDVELLDERGQPVRFYSDLIAGRVVAINFIFTSCQMVCPILGVNFATLQRQLPERIGDDLQLISISIDPLTDSPEKLAAWRDKVGGSATGWTLLTGDKRQIDTVLNALQVFAADREDHSSFVVIGNAPRGYWTRVGGLASAEVIRRELEAAARQ